MLVVPAGQRPAPQQAEVRRLGPRERHLPGVQQQHTHTGARADRGGTDHSIEHNGSTSHDTLEMNSTGCSDHAEPADCNTVSQ